MKRPEIEQVLLELFAVVLGSEVSLETNRSNMASWDSLQHMQIVFAVEERFGVQFKEEEIGDLGSVRQLADYLQSHYAT
jgi:acyl carrier protein